MILLMKKKKKRLMKNLPNEEILSYGIEINPWDFWKE